MDIRSPRENSEFLFELWKKTAGKNGKAFYRGNQTFFDVNVKDPVSRKGVNPGRMQNGMIVHKGVLPGGANSIPGYCELFVDNIREIIYYGSGIIRSKDSNKIEVAKIVIPATGLTVNPNTDRDLMCYLDLCVWNRNSPVYTEGSGLDTPMRSHPRFYRYDPMVTVIEQSRENDVQFSAESFVRHTATTPQLQKILLGLGGIDPVDAPDYWHALKATTIGAIKNNPSKAWSIIKEISPNTYNIAQEALDTGVITFDDKAMYLNGEVVTRVASKPLGDNAIAFVNEALVKYSGLLAEVEEGVKRKLSQRGVVAEASPVFGEAKSIHNGPTIEETAPKIPPTIKKKPTPRVRL